LPPCTALPGRCNLRHQMKARIRSFRTGDARHIEHGGVIVLPKGARCIYDR
jgi:hypothetical protein